MTDHDVKADPAGLLGTLRAFFVSEPASIRDDIEDALEDQETAGEFTGQERALLKNVLRLRDTSVYDVMVPRTDIIAVGFSAPLLDVLAVFRSAGHSRLPVHGETLDDPRGMVHIRDLVNYLATLVEQVGGLQASTTMDLQKTLLEAKIVRPLLFVPPSMPVLDLLLRMQATRTHMALVIDEYGGTDGLVSIEDLVERIVGDIEDEHDVDESPQIESSPDGSFIIDARATLEDVEQQTKWKVLDLSEEEEEVHTMGGLVSALAGRVPVRGEIVTTAHGLEIEILDADPRRVKRVKASLPLQHKRV